MHKMHRLCLIPRFASYFLGTGKGEAISADETKEIDAVGGIEISPSRD